MFQLAEDERHHEPAVQRGIFLCPAYRLNIVREVLCSFRQVGEVFIGQVDMMDAHILFRPFDEGHANLVANTP